MVRLKTVWRKAQVQIARLLEVLQNILRRINQVTGGALSIISIAIQRFGQTRAAENAATLSYYTLFSIFPFLISLIVAGSFFLEREEVYQRVQDLVTQVFPASQALIHENINTVLTLHTSTVVLRFEPF